MLIAILAASAVLSLVSAVLFQSPGLLGRDKVLTDFDAFYLAGTMAGQGRAVQAYQATEMLAAEQALTGTQYFMPWTYPPPVTLFVEGLAQLPIGVAYLLFIWASLAFYLFVLRRIAGAYLPGVLIAVLPTILLVVRTGQNGFLVAGLVGCFLLAFHRARAVAGVPLGLMVIKPHLAAGIALLCLLGRRWSAMGVTAAIVVAALLAATMALGSEIWPAFFAALREAGAFLAAGYYPLFRMSSIYASVVAFGGSAELAFGIQAVGALGAIALLVRAWHRGWEQRPLAAMACVCSLFVSPYNYDYDLAILGMAIAFVLPEIVEKARRWELAGLLILSWAVTGYGLMMNTIEERAGLEAGIPPSLQSPEFPSLTGPLLLIFVTAGFAILRRRGAAPSAASSLVPASEMGPN